MRTIDKITVAVPSHTAEYAEIGANIYSKTYTEGSGPFGLWCKHTLRI